MPKYEVTCEALNYSYASDKEICLLEAALSEEYSKRVALESYNVLFAIALEADEVSEKNTKKILKKMKEIWEKFKLGVRKFISVVKERITKAVIQLKDKINIARKDNIEKNLAGKDDISAMVTARTKYFMTTEFEHFPAMLKWIQNPSNAPFESMSEVAEKWVTLFMDRAPSQNAETPVTVDAKSALESLRKSLADMESLKKALDAGEKTLNEAIRKAQNDDDVKYLGDQKSDIIAAIDMLMKVYRQRVTATISVCSAMTAGEKKEK